MERLLLGVSSSKTHWRIFRDEGSFELLALEPCERQAQLSDVYDRMLRSVLLGMFVWI